MANRDDVTRELAECTECGSVYAARRWPNGDIQTIGSGSCSCGSTDFVLIDDVEDAENIDSEGSPSGVGTE
ncbi:hypothetical protein CV102_21320 [Natronococcus pandeyae]|uniref:Uncharacterized protein n=1 Tax=Natronococcus pandeyae TaxID=2055836 RepID=A0A8J8PXC4_9EURY|nr:hypothetical protein [Natronococcus pandeyae]TYL36596.1 hypothetical protein CV102_21320 [Natronococcus pandeyae]